MRFPGSRPARELECLVRLPWFFGGTSRDVVLIQALVVWVPDPNLLAMEYSGKHIPDQTLCSIEEFRPEEWGLPPYE